MGRACKNVYEKCRFDSFEFYNKEASFTQYNLNLEMSQILLSNFISNDLVSFYSNTFPA